MICKIRKWKLSDAKNLAIAHTCKKSKELFVIHISSCYNTSTENTHDRVAASRVYENRCAGIHRKGGCANDSF